MKNRHKIVLSLSRIDKWLELIGWISLVGIWVYTLMNYSKLPDQIPIHFNLAGEADRFGNSIGILLLPLVATVLFIGMGIVNKYPHKFNYPTIITPHNAVYQYTIATRMIRSLKLSIVLIFGLIVYETIKYTQGDIDGLGTWSLPLILILIFAPVVYFLVLGARRDSSTSDPEKWIN